MVTLPDDDVVAVTLVQAIRGGDIDALRRLLDERPELVSARLQSDKGTTRTLLHVATDWPGYFPNGPAAVDLLISAGADPNAPQTGGWHAETPLHWAASSDDVEVAAALIDGGANIEATGGSIGGGTPLDNAVRYGCWARCTPSGRARCSRREALARRSLGMMSRVQEFLASNPPPTPRDINNAFWQACAAGQRRVGEHLLANGADINWVPDYAKKTPLDVAGSLDTRRDTFVTRLRDLGARSAES